MNTLAHIQQLADSLKASQPPPVKTPVLPANQLGFPLQNPTQFFQGSNQAQQHFNVPNVFPNLSFPGQPNQFPNQMNNFNNPSPIRERPADEVNDSHRSKRSRFDDNDRKMSSHSNNSMPLNLSAKPTFPTRVHGPDSSIDIHHIRILSRTLYVGGIQATTSIEMLRPFFENYNIETIILHRGKFNGFVKLHTREDAEKAKNELSSHAQIDGVPLKVLK